MQKVKLRMTKANHPYQLMFVIDKVAHDVNSKVNGMSHEIIQVTSICMISFEEALTLDQLSAFVTPDARLLLITKHVSKDYEGVTLLITFVDIIDLLSRRQLQFDDYAEVVV